MKELLLQSAKQAQIELMARRPKTGQRYAQSSQIILDYATALSNTVVAAKRAVTLQPSTDS